MSQTNLTNLPLAFGLVLSAAIIAAAAVVITFALTSNQTQAKYQAIDGCLAIAQGKDITSSTDKSSWSVEKANINQDIYTDCMSKKGL